MPGSYGSGRVWSLIHQGQVGRTYSNGRGERSRTDTIRVKVRSGMDATHGRAEAIS